MFGANWSIPITIYIIVMSFLTFLEASCSTSIFWREFLLTLSFTFLVVILPAFWITGIFTI